MTPDLAATEYRIPNASSYWITRFMILRFLGLVYAIAFAVAINQLIPLIRSNGLLPLNNYLELITGALGSKSAGFWGLPSVFLFWHSDAALLTVAWIGFILSCLVLSGYANAIILSVTWFLY